MLDFLKINYGNKSSDRNCIEIYNKLQKYIDHMLKTYLTPFWS